MDEKALKKQTKGKDIVLFTLSKSDYSDKVLGLAGFAAREGGNICYVSVNKPASALLKAFDSGGIDTKKFRFVDCISSSASGGGAKGSAVIFVSSPRNLTEISIAISKMVANVKSCVFVDALSTFLIYEDPVVVTRFAHDLITKLRGSGHKGFFILLKNDISGALLDDLGMFVDGVVEI